MMNDPDTTLSISARGVSKRYRLGQAEERAESLVSAIGTFLMSPLSNWKRLSSLSNFKDEAGTSENDILWALRDVSFDIHHGEVVGVIGHNGAGKSTLLKILSQITEPTSGYADMKGRVASLLEVGTGFHPELTGHENIFLNGTILGMTDREIRDNYDEIVAFSGIEKFIHTPVKRYSSGMKVRLAFAVAAHLEPEILLIDEVLAVGDTVFQKKCLGKMNSFTRSGRTIIFVSHNLGAVREICPRTLLFSHGELIYDGPTEEALKRYQTLADVSEQPRLTFEADPTKPLSFLEVKVTARNKELSDVLDINDDLTATITYQVHEEIQGANMALALSRESVPVFASFDIDTAPERMTLREPGLYEASIQFPHRLLKAGRYTLKFDLGRPGYQRIAVCPGDLTFDIEEHSENVSHLSYAKFRQGSLIMPLDWNVKNAESRDK